MKKSFLLLSAFFVLSISCKNNTVQKISSIDEKMGFKDLKLETHVNQYESLQTVLLHEYPDVHIKVFKVQNEKYLKIGTINLSEVEITTIDDTISKITISKKDALIEGDDLIDVLNEQYGKATQMPDKSGYYWTGNNCVINYNISDGDIIGMAEVSFSSVRLSEKFLSYSKQQKILNSSEL